MLTILVSIAIVALGILIYISLQKYHSGFKISIENKTKVEVKGIKITYANLDSDIAIPPIKPKRRYKTDISPNYQFSESSLTLYYTDKLGKKHQDTVIPYFQQGYRGVAVVRILSVDKNGIMKIRTSVRNY